MSLLAQAKAVTYVMTRNRATARAFYRDVLGLAMTADEDHSTVFDLNGTPLHITESGDHTASPHPVLGFDVADIAAVVQGLAAKEVRCTIYPGFGQDDHGIWTSPDGKTRLAWFNDPDGNVLMLNQG